MSARLPNHPDVEFMLMLSAGPKPEAHGVLERTDAADGSGEREIGGLAGEEPVQLMVEENEARVHSPWWEVSGTEDKVLVPHVVFRMSTGNGNRQPVPSSLSDGAALGVWDKISSSIRLRTSARSRRGTDERSMAAP